MTAKTLTAAALVAATGALALAPTATAAPPSTTASKTNGGSAYVQWTERDPGDALGLPGNTHVGYLGVYQQPGWTDVYGAIEDLQCEPGQVVGGHGESGAGFCTPVGTRSLSAPSAVTFTADARAGTARLTGTLVVSNGGHGGDGTVLANPPADITWAKTGGDYTFKRTEAWSDGTTSYSSRVDGSGFAAAVSGRIGAMGFTDDADDTSTASAEAWRETSRSRTKA